MTSTMPLFRPTTENSVNNGLNRDDCEPLHHWLHLIAELTERDAASVLVDMVAETLGADAVGRLVEALQRQAEAAGKKR